MMAESVAEAIRHVVVDGRAVIADAGATGAAGTSRRHCLTKLTDKVGATQDGSD